VAVSLPAQLTGMRSGIELAPGLVVPDSDLEWRFSTTGGPGGQHANRSSTRADVALDLRASSLPPDVVETLLARLGKRAASGVISISVGESRSQWRNRQIAKHRLREVLQSALREHAVRQVTGPTPSSVERRLARKRWLSRKKRLRRPPEPD